MRSMKPSEIPSLCTIPSSWEVIKLKNLLTLRSEKNSGGRELLSVYLNRGVISYSESSGMQVHKPSADLSNYQNVHVGDFVLNNQQAWRGSVGVSFFEGIISPAYFVYKFNRECDYRFMNYLLRDVSMVQQYETSSRGVGTIQRNLYAPWFLESKIALPTVDEQKLIANFLDDKCAQIDELIHNIETQIDTLESHKQSTITEAVIKGLDSTVTWQNTDISWAKEIPSHWRTMPNKYLMKKTKTICPIYQGQDILSLTMNGVLVRDLDAGGKMPASFDGYQIVEPNNLLMCLFDIDVTPRCIGLIRNNGLTSPAYSQFKMKPVANERYYYYYYLMLDYTKELLHLAKNLRHSLTEDQLGAIKHVVPPIEEQIAIADYLDDKCAQIDAVIADKKAQLETLNNYKKSIIFEYVTGKKEVV